MFHPVSERRPEEREGANARAVRDFWRRERHALLRLCRRWTRDPNEAEDLLAEACLRTLESAAARALPIENPAAYCARIVVNLGRDRWRARRRRAEHGGDADSEALLEVADTAASSELRLAMKRRLEAAFLRLPALNESQRVALVSRARGDEYGDIADRLGTNSANVRKLVQTARGALRAPRASRRGPNEG